MSFESGLIWGAVTWIAGAFFLLVVALYLANLGIRDEDERDAKMKAEREQESARQALNH